MSEQADKETRLWKANYSETGKLRGGPCVWLYNPRGEAVVLMFPQDRPEADGVVTEIVNGLNAALSAQEPKVCEWTMRDGEWCCGCDDIQFFGGFNLSESKFDFCPYCSYRIKVKE